MNSSFKIIRQIFLLCFVFFFFSCNFNSKFYHPQKIIAPYQVTITDNETADTLYTMHLLADSLAPIFVDSQNDTIDFIFNFENILLYNELDTKLHGWIISPPDSLANDVTLTFLHGNGGNVVRYLSLVFPFVEQGYQVFLFDYSGFGFSEGSPTRQSVLMDGNAALSFIASRSDMERKKLVVYGQSLGGHLAPTVAKKNSELVDAVVIEGAFSSHKDIAAASAGFLGRLFVRESYPATKALTGLELPVLIIHSTDDNVVPYQLGEKLYQHAKQPKYFMEVDGCHICAPLHYAEEISSRIESMLNRKK